MVAAASSAIAPRGNAATGRRTGLSSKNIAIPVTTIIIVVGVGRFRSGRLMVYPRRANSGNEAIYM